jgi:hypothetical protein
MENKDSIAKNQAKMVNVGVVFWIKRDLYILTSHILVK